MLLAELGHPDPALLAHAPLAPLSADLSRYLRRVRGGADPAVIRATLAHLAAVLGGGPGGGR